VKRVLVTGALGQVGAAVAERLRGRFEVTALDRAALDLAEPGQIAERVREARPDIIVNAAAYTAVDRAESDAQIARAVNAEAPGVLAVEAARAGAVLIHFSTDYVFDGTKDAPYVETDPPHPLGVYGATKLAGERAIEATGCDYVILRTSWVYGPHGKNFLLTMLNAAKTREEVRVVDDQHGAPTSALQLARATDLLLQRGIDALRSASGTYHATAAGGVTWHGFAQAIFERWAARSGAAFKAPRVIPIPTSEYPTPVRRPANSLLSNAKLAATFGIALEPWEAALDEVLVRLGDRSLRDLSPKGPVP
jgi:dTDP-4-dehydrorhamnose reductase